MGMIIKEYDGNNELKYIIQSYMSCSTMQSLKYKELIQELFNKLSESDKEKFLRSESITKLNLEELKILLLNFQSIFNIDFEYILDNLKSDSAKYRFFRKTHEYNYAFNEIYVFKDYHSRRSINELIKEVFNVVNSDGIISILTLDLTDEEFDYMLNSKYSFILKEAPFKNNGASQFLLNSKLRYKESSFKRYNKLMKFYITKKNYRKVILNLMIISPSKEYLEYPLSLIDLSYENYVNLFKNKKSKLTSLIKSIKINL